MTKNELKEKTDRAVNETRDALQTVYDALNNGQQKQIVKNEAVKALFDRYGVIYG
jgi:hypothetical protein